MSDEIVTIPIKDRTIRVVIQARAWLQLTELADKHDTTVPDLIDDCLRFGVATLQDIDDGYQPRLVKEGMLYIPTFGKHIPEDTTEQSYGKGERARIGAVLVVGSVLGVLAIIMIIAVAGVILLSR